MGLRHWRTSFAPDSRRGSQRGAGTRVKRQTRSELRRCWPPGAEEARSRPAAVRPGKDEGASGGDCASSWRALGASALVRRACRWLQQHSAGGFTVPCALEREGEGPTDLCDGAAGAPVPCARVCAVPRHHPPPWMCVCVCVPGSFSPRLVRGYARVQRHTPSR